VLDSCAPMVLPGESSASPCFMSKACARTTEPRPPTRWCGGACERCSGSLLHKSRQIAHSDSETRRKYLSQKRIHMVPNCMVLIDHIQTNRYSLWGFCSVLRSICAQTENLSRRGSERAVAITVQDPPASSLTIAAPFNENVGLKLARGEVSSGCSLLHCGGTRIFVDAPLPSEWLAQGSGSTTACVAPNLEASTVLYLETLGRIRLTAGPHRDALPVPRLSLWLITFLALTRGRMHATEALMELFWPDCDPAKGVPILALRSGASGVPYPRRAAGCSPVTFPGRSA